MTGFETESIALGKAQIDMIDGKQEQAAEAFHDLIVSQSPETAHAVVASVEIAEQAGTHVPERVVELSAAYSTELRNSEEGPDLWEAHLKSLVLNGRFGDAISVLDSVEGVPNSLLKQARNSTYSIIILEAEDPFFLKFYFRDFSKNREQLQDNHVLQAAKRVLNLGLPEAALETLSVVEEAEMQREKRIVQAQALIKMSRPEEAEILLIGLAGPKVSALRAQARSEMGDHDYAGNIYAELGAEDQEVREAWLSGNWSRVASIHDGPLAAAARMVQGGANVSSEGPISLGQAETLFAASADTRETITGLLDATQILNQNQ